MGNGIPGAESTTAPARGAEDPLRLAIEEAGLSTWNVDLRTREAIWSANHFRLFGYPVDPTGRAKFEMWASRLHPEDRQRVLEEIEHAAREHLFYRSEYRILRADTGGVVWVEPRGRFFYDAHGRAIRQVGVCLDITTRKQAEEQLVRREAQLDLATRLVGAGVFEHDHLDNRVYWSDEFRQIHGLPPSVEPSFTLLDAQTHPDDRAALTAAVAAAHNPGGDGKFSFEYRIKRSDGQTRRIAGRAQTLFIGEGAERRPVRTVGAELDMTDRRLAEAKIRDSEARFRTMADGSPVMIWAMDADGRIEFVNRAVCEFFGATLEQLRGTGWEPLLHPDDVLPYSAAYEAAVAERRQFRAQARVRKANGDWRWIESHATPRLEPSGDFLGYVGVSPDITVLVEAQEALREADQRKDDFLATLAHELRNPLAPIRTAAEVLTRPGLSDAQLAWSRQVIHRQVEHMARLLDDLLDVARITRGRVDLKIEPVDLGTVVDTAIEAARPLIIARRHGLTIDLPPELPTLNVDPVRLAQVLSNLLTNAAKYTDPPGHIELTARVDGAALRISVKDDGIGIPPTVGSKIFEMFSQGQNAHGRGESGLGIGLALVKGLVELHGGTVEARSDGPGRGSEFVVTLPCGHVPARAHVPAAQASVPTIARRILIADDNEDAADALAMFLRLAGHEVCTAHGGQAALKLASTFRPEVALLDIGMPDLSGYDVARQLRGSAANKGLRLIALTGWGQEDDKRRARDAGFDHHLTKPVDPRRLDALLLNGAA